MTKQYFTKEEVMDLVNEQIEFGFDGDALDLLDVVANQDYYIIGTAEAKSALEQYGVFKAIQKVKEYEETNLGELSTDISNSEKLANMLFYIIAEETIGGELDNIQNNTL